MYKNIFCIWISRVTHFLGSLWSFLLLYLLFIVRLQQLLVQDCRIDNQSTWIKLLIRVSQRISREEEMLMILSSWYSSSIQIFFKKSLKILNWPWRAHFWAHRHLSYHFGNLWTSTRRWLKGNWPKVARSITYWPFFENIFCSRNFWFPTFGILMFLMKSHFFKELLRILEKNLWNGPQKWVFGEFFFEIMPESKNDQG